MSAPEGEESPAVGTATDPVAVSEARSILDAAQAAKSRTDTLLTELERATLAAEAQSQETQQFRIDAAARVANIDELLSTLRGKAARWQQDIETATARAAEISAIQVSAASALQAVDKSAETAVRRVNEIGDLRSSAQAGVTQTVETNAQALAALEAIRVTASGAVDAANRAEAFRVQIEQTAGVVATRSEHVEAGRVHTDDVRAKIDNLFTVAQQSATAAEARHQAARATADEVVALYAAIQTTKANIDAMGESITTLRGQSEKSTAVAKSLADRAEKIEESILASEKRLDELQMTASKHLNTIESLLLGATNAGLASAFDKRGQTFKQPEQFWLFVESREARSEAI